MGSSAILASCLTFKTFLSPASRRVNVFIRPVPKQVFRLHASLCSAKLPCFVDENENRFRNPHVLCYRDLCCRAGKGSDIHEKDQETYSDLIELMSDHSKATTFVHSVWRRIVKVGDTVIDATCGNGYDTVLLAKLTSGEDCLGCVYAFDIQKVALQNTSSLMNQELTVNQKRQVRLVQTCHSKIEVIVKDRPIRLVAFNLGYLPGGDKSLITCSATSLAALLAATKCVQFGGLISIVAYVGHASGREEYDAVKGFISGLPKTDWISTHLEYLNRPLGPRLIFALRK